MLNPDTTEAKKERQDYQRGWFLVVVVGAVVILAVNLLFGGGDGPNPLIAWIVAIILSLLMAWYSWSCRRNEYLSPDTKADGIYYQGLLFTFGSLVAALIAFGSQEGSGEVTGAVITNFGIALLTTIVGLAGRVLFSMSQGVLGEIEGTAIRELDEAVERFKGSVRRGAESMENLVGHMGESTEAMRSTAQQAVEIMRSLGDDVEGVTKTAGVLKDRQREIRSAIRGLGTELRQVEEVLRKGSTTWSKFGEDVARFGGSMDESERTIRKLNAAAAATTRDVESLTKTTKEVKETFSQVGDAKESLTSLREDLNHVRKAGQGLEQEMERSSRRFASARSTAEASEEPIRNLISVAASTGRGIEVAGQASQSFVGKVHETEIPDVRPDLAGLRGRVSGLTRALDDVGSVAAETEGILKRYRENLRARESDLQIPAWLTWLFGGKRTRSDKSERSPRL